MIYFYFFVLSINHFNGEYLIESRQYKNVIKHYESTMKARLEAGGKKK